MPLSSYLPPTAIQTRLILVKLLLLALWLIDDEPFTVWHSLEWHEPSARIFRVLWQIDILLWGTAASLALWYRYLGKQTVQELLFYTGLDYNNEYTLQRSLSDEYVSLVKPGSNDNDVEEIDDENVEVEGDGDTERRVNRVSLTSLDDMPTGADADADMDGDYVNNMSNGDNNAAIQAPQVMSVVKAALDLLLYLLVTLFLYVFSLSAKSMWLARIAAPTFPLLLFLLLAYRLFYVQRLAFWKILNYTTSAPWYRVTFRDGMIGDILTSSVRPLQDLSFTLAYMTCGLTSWWSQGRIDLRVSDSTALPMLERSWILHTIVMPMCLISPLWWRFAQTLRQCSDERQRWPYLGNSAKYFGAAQVAMIGVFFPQYKATWWWVTSFIAATLYQVWWDVFMDWNLLEKRADSSNGNSNSSIISFFSAYKLRSNRLYPWKSLYWAVFAINFVLRFGWTLTLMPSNYLDPTGLLRNNWPSLLNSTMATAELVRRTLWAWIRVEWQAVSHNSDDREPSEIAMKEIDYESRHPMDLDGMQSMTIPSRVNTGTSSIVSLDMKTMSMVHIYMELGLYTTAFCALWLVAAAHRMTL